MRTELFAKSKKVVIKIGTSTMLKDGRFDVASVRRIAGDIVRLASLYPDKKFVIVSSGAIGMGMKILAKKTRPTSLSELQALAALGQPELMKVFSTVFSKHNRYGCQVLLTWNDFSNRKNYLKTQKALEAMLTSRMIPIINENDTVATEEIEFGDNDQLSSLVALMFHADLHILLTDSNGLYSDYSQGDVSRISIVPELNSKILKWVYEAPGKHTKGGMGSKLSAIDKSLSGSIPCVLASGCHKGVLKKLFEGRDIGTVFTPKVKTMSSKKHWIANLNKC
ncbi:MAG: glutamate 5-kinase, partial [Candidatus Omnitrophica bacterium]|nr:glutamate 5-kinase [Candidatus Omnitrophota bacterium]